MRRMLARAQMADRACILFLLILLGIPNKSIENLTSGYSKLQYGFRLDRRMIDSYVEYSILDCVGEFLRSTRCYSLNYYKGANYCELNYENKTSVPEKFVENEGWIYSEREDWEKELAGPCSNKVCEINEKCINIGCNTSCQISDCGVPFTRKMTSDSVQWWDGIGVERRIHVKCSEEYQQNGSGIFICNRNGKWNSDMSCNGKRLGCFKEYSTWVFEPPDFVRFIETNNLTRCTRHCIRIDKEFKYIGLQNGYACFCGHRIRLWPKVPDEECNFPCPGDVRQTCGGRMKNEIFTVEEKLENIGIK